MSWIQREREKKAIDAVRACVEKISEENRGFAEAVLRALEVLADSARENSNAADPRNFSNCRW
jgi:hypothetical protein